jgi:hypothetical protein
MGPVSRYSHDHTQGVFSMPHWLGRPAWWYFKLLRTGGCVRRGRAVRELLPLVDPKMGLGSGFP